MEGLVGIASVDPDYILLAEVDLHSPAEDILHHSSVAGTVVPDLHNSLGST